MQTLNDLCFGFVPGRTGLSGVCSCGLHWEGEMPPHDAKGRPVHLDRIDRRNREAAEADLARMRDEGGGAG